MKPEGSDLGGKLLGMILGGFGFTRAFRARFDVLVSLFDAQAAQIRVGVFFFLGTNKNIIFYAQAAYIRAIGGSRALRRPLVDAQAAQIRVGVIFYVFVFKQTHHLLCAGCVHTRHR